MSTVLFDVISTISQIILYSLFMNDLKPASKPYFSTEVALEPSTASGEVVDAGKDLNYYAHNSKFGADIKQDLKKKRFRPGKILAAIMILFSVCIFLFGTYVVVFGRASGNLGAITGESQFDIFGGIFKTLAGTSETKLLGQDSGRTNILIVGVDANGYLADTQIVVSYLYESKQFVFLTIPRDTYTSSIYGTQKINETYAYAEQNEERSGPKLLGNIYEKEWGLKIHYWSQLDFQGVEDLINELGGVEVVVEHSFRDCSFPTKNYIGYLPCKSFTAGPAKMDGTEALIFARSRLGYTTDNSGFNEGSDFARSRRQTIIIEALLKKLQSENGKDKFDPRKLNSYLDILGKNLRVSMKTEELKSFYDTFYKRVREGGEIKTTKINLSNDPELGIFCDFNNGQYYLAYCDGATVGGTAYSAYREKAKKLITGANSATVSSSGNSVTSLNLASAIVLSNGYDKFRTVFNEFRDAGVNLCTGCYNNAYTEIKKNSSPSVKVYIENKDLREAFEKEYKGKTNFTFETRESLSKDNKVLTANNSGTDIIIWIE
jgi:LCP family protein required for cell wall assembly